MGTIATMESSIDMSETLEHQKKRFLAEELPSLKLRQANLTKLRTALLQYRTELHQSIEVDFGHRSKYETDILELNVTLQSIDYLSRALPKLMKRQSRQVDWLYRCGSAYIDYQPLGVIGVMSPWNYPLSLTMIPLATALAAGNRVMIKPSELTPRTSEVMQKLLASVFHADEVTVVLGGAETGAQFSQLAFDHLFFTGSTMVGRKVMKAASDNLVPITLELGGKSPVILARGEINQKNVDRIVFGKLANSGQTCVAPDYAFVHQDDLNRFVELYSSSVARFYPDGPASLDYTSIISESHYRRLNSLLENARAYGANVIEVGKKPELAKTRQRTIAPTLVTDLDTRAALMEEEIFGPILPVITYSDVEQVIHYINERPRPLALYYFGQRDSHRERLLQRTTSGNVGINTTILHVAQDDLPFGGVGASGIGAYHGVEGFRAMSHAKGTFVQGHWSLPNLLRAPYGRFTDRILQYLLRSKPFRLLSQ